MEKINFIKSPINYTGNKYRLLPQFCGFFPNKSKLFVDLFCGGATVGINMNAEKIVMIDNNPMVISLLEYLANEEIEVLIKNIEKVIDKYNLTYSAKYGYKNYKKKLSDNNGLKEFNKNGFYKLRDNYNSLSNKKTKKANTILYTLMVYGFNNDLRFNKIGNYNLPVGKTDFNKNNLKKIIEYNKKAKEKNILFLCAEYDSEEAKKYIFNADFVYIDPPYLITTAVYNEGNNWNDQREKELINLLDDLNNRNIKFALSNVLTKVGIDNIILKNWLDKKENENIKLNDMDYHYRSCSYNKKDRDANEQEVLITN
ncbi:MAG: Dam family site-specific DNA-(adenine-N6)-methyltransferase [Malacoplasma sp.]